MNQSTLISRSVLQTLISAGVTTVVVSPGSRSAGLAIAAASASQAGVIDLHVRIDEREAGFLALGIAKESRKPVAVIVTSGTAVANLMPAVVEANYSAIPLVLITADRPEAVRFSGASQTINQVPMFLPYVRAVVDLEVEATLKDVEDLANTIDAALSGRRGPIHVNVQMDMPIVPDALDDTWLPRPTEHSASVHVMSANTHDNDVAIEVDARGLMIVGDCANGNLVTQAAIMAQRLGWPIIWEPSANIHNAAMALDHGPLICPSLPTPEFVVTIGTVGLSRSTLAILKKTQCHIAIHDESSGPNLPNPVLSASEILDYLPNYVSSPEPSWLALWKSADDNAKAVVSAALAEHGLTSAAAAVQLWNHIPDGDALVLGASWPVRHVELYAPARTGVTVYGNRGVNGIDGLISTAYGIALARTRTHGKLSRTYLCLGDISFLYGMGGLLDSGEPRPNLTIVVLDNDGGGIFSQLEQGQPEHAQHFEQIFATPQGRDLWVVAEALGVAATRVTSPQEMQKALEYSDSIPGLHVIVCSGATRNNDMKIIDEISSGVNAVLKNLTE